MFIFYMRKKIANLGVQPHLQVANQFAYVQHAWGVNNGVFFIRGVNCILLKTPKYPWDMDK